jgi:hypothetical protein
MRRLLFHQWTLQRRLMRPHVLSAACLAAAWDASAARACPTEGVCAAQVYAAPVQQVVVPQYVAPVQAVQVQTYAVPVVQPQVAVQAYTAPIVQRQLAVRTTIPVRARLFGRARVQRQVIRTRGVAANAALVY